MKTIEDIRGTAKLNLCDRCYPVYTSLIEPNFKGILDEFFHDWQEVEALVFGMVLKHAGAIKRPTEFILEIDERDLPKFVDNIDADIYKHVKHEYRYFKDQLKYLHDNGVIGPKLRDYIIQVQKRRNKVHRYKQSISDTERILFYLASQALQHIQSGMVRPDMSDYHRHRQAEKIDLAAVQYLKLLKIK